MFKVINNEMSTSAKCLVQLMKDQKTKLML